MAKAGLPQGTRDFSSEILKKRTYILETIKKIFQVYSFEPLETPAIENISTLLGKYGDEGDKLIFKVLNNGLNDPKNIEKSKKGFEDLLAGKVSEDVTSRALRYDLTIPLARFIAMNFNNIYLPFKRYQIQQVWRADRPQRGRYREFTQCDADIVGSYSLSCEAELANIYHDVFAALGLNRYELKVNNRKVLAALARKCGGNNKLIPLTVAIDKLDKIGIEKVEEELKANGFTDEQVQIIKKFLDITGTNQQKLDTLNEIFVNDEEGLTGVKELTNVIQHTKEVNISIDLTLARGLNYYTGVIFEAKAPKEVNMGSIGGGGRYDDLTGLFGVKNIPGVGISFGVDRIYDVLEELNLFPKNIFFGPDVLFLNLGESESSKSMELLKPLRKRNFSGEVFHEQTKIDKQMKYADRKNFNFAAIIGPEEFSQNMVTMKNLKTGEQQKILQSELFNFLSKFLHK